MMKRTLLWAGVSMLFAVHAAAADHDLVIRGGRVLDGAGNPWVRADVAVKDGRVVQVGQVPGQGTREIDATGRYVSPGFIDMMDQSGAALLKDGAAMPTASEGAIDIHPVGLHVQRIHRFMQQHGDMTGGDW